MSAFIHHIELSQREIDDALPKFLRSFQDKPLDDRAAAMPLGIVSLLTQELISDFTGMRPDLITSYWDYYNQLVCTPPSSRGTLPAQPSIFVERNVN